MADLSRWLAPDTSGQLNRFIWFRDSHEEPLKDLTQLAQWPELKEIVLHGHELVEASSSPCWLHLERLALTDCQLNSIPEGLPIRSLQTIDLSGNELTDIEPLAEAFQLNELGLAHNPLKQLPASTNWQALRVLNLTGTPSALLLDRLFEVSSLRVLYVKQRCLPEKTPALSQIEQLFASLEGERPLLDYGSWTGLRTLHLHVKNRIDLSNLVLPPCLEELTLTHGMMARLLPDWSQVPKLERLNLHYLAVQDLKSISQAASLKRLSIKGCPVSAAEVRKQFPHVLVVS
jgi:Leucine-rich repeat (LRR) protein